MKFQKYFILFYLYWLSSCQSFENTDYLTNSNTKTYFIKYLSNDSLRVVKYFNPNTNDTSCYLIKQIYSNGKTECVGKIKNNLKEGVWKSWYDNGQLATDEFYVNGVRKGKYKSWYPDGNTLEEIDYPK